MRKILLLGVFFTFCALPAQAQFTIVTGTVKDVNGVAYAGGTISASLVVPGNCNPTLNGVGFTGSMSPIGLDGTGSFTARLADNNVVNCGGTGTTQWKFQVNTTGAPPPLGTGPQTCTATLTITGASQSISSSFSACPALGNASGGSASVPGATIYNPGGGVLIGDYQFLPTEAVASLPDHSGANNNATGTAGTAPTILPGGGLSCVGTGGVILPIHSNQPITIQAFISYQMTSNTNVFNAILAGNGGGTTTGAMSMLLSSTSSGTQPPVPGGTGRLWTYANNAQAEATLGSFNGNDVISLTLQTTGAGGDVYYEGYTKITNTFSAGGSLSATLSGTDNLQICGAAAGSGNTSQTYFTGTIARLLIYKSALTDAQVAQNVSALRLDAAAKNIQQSIGSTSSKNILVVVGDSIAATNGLADSWVTQDSNHMILYDNYDVINQSFSGVLSINQLPFFSTFVAPYYRANATRNVFVIATGSNDVGTNLATLPFLAVTRAAVQAARAQGWKVVVATMLDRGNSVANSQAYAAFNQVLRQYVWDMGAPQDITLLDFGSQVNLGCSLCSGNATYFQDTIHPTETGVRLMAPLASNVINRMFGDSQYSGSPTIAKNQTAGQFVQSTSNTGNGTALFTSGSFGFPQANIPGDTIVIACEQTPSSITDTNQNSYSQIVTNSGAVLWFAANIRGGEPNTVTVNYSPAKHNNCNAAEYGGMQTAPLDVSGGANGSSTSLSSGNITSGGSNELFVGGGGSGGAIETFTAGASFTLRASLQPNVSTFIEDQLIAAAGANPCTATMAPTGFWFMLCAAFKTQAVSTYNATASDAYIWCDPSAGSETINLIDAEGITGTKIFVKNLQTSGTNTCTLVPQAGQTIDGAASMVIPNGDTIVLASKLVSTTAANNIWVRTTPISSFKGLTGSIGGGSLTVGTCATGTATVQGAAAGMTAEASASDGTFVGGNFTIYASVTSANTVTVNVCNVNAAAQTPAAKTYLVSVHP